MFKFLYRRKIKKKLNHEDLLAAMVLVNPLLNKLNRTVPFSQYSVRPFAVAILCNEILMNKRNKYIEFGGGISTILLAKYIQVNELDAKITVVENDDSWLEYINKGLVKENLRDYVSLIHAPLKQYTSPMGKINWFDKEILKKQLSDSYDLAFVDGPPGKNYFHRYEALPFLINNSMLAKDHAFYLDDAGRKPEKKIIKQWEKEFSVTFDTILEQLAYYHKGQSYKIRLTNN